MRARQDLEQEDLDARREVMSEMKARTAALRNARRQARRLRDDPVFLRLYCAAIVGCSGQYERREEGDWPQEKYYTDLERVDLLAERALLIAVSAWEQLFQDTEADLERFNSKIMQTEPEPDTKAP